MRREVALSPLAFVISGCAGALQTPSQTAADRSDALPVSYVDAPARTDAIRTWLLPAGDPWAPYAKYTLLSALAETRRPVLLPGVEALDEVQRARAAAYAVAALGLPADTLWVVDLRGAASVAFGTALSQGPSSVSLVLTFNNWPGTNELVPAEETLAALVSMAPALPPDADQAGVPIFLLDSWRMAFKDDEPGDEVYDNRYFLNPADLPDVETLRMRGVRRVVYVVDRLGDSSLEDDDLHAVFAAWQQAGIRVAMVDLDVIGGPIAVADWDRLWVDRWLVVAPRVTIFDTPGFFARARGGFGGVRARPAVVGRVGAQPSVVGGAGSHAGVIIGAHASVFAAHAAGG
jgi:hypothetical protein